MFIPTLFIVARIWEQPKCPSAGKWIKKTWCIDLYTLEYYLAFKKKTLTFTTYG